MRIFSSANRFGCIAVSHVVGFILTFVVISAATATVIYTTGVLAENRIEYATRIVARDIANYVVDAITEAIALKQQYPLANYSRVLEIPSDINGKPYYVEITDDRVYVNTTDGEVSESCTTYNQGELTVGISGKAYSYNGKLRVYCNNSEYVLKLDFGTLTSPGGYKFTRMSQSYAELYDGWNSTYLNWSYRAPIRVINSGGNLSDYQVKVVLTPNNFDYTNVKPDGSDIRITNSSNHELYYWIERWNYNGLSVIWFKADKLLANTTTEFFLYYGNSNCSVTPYNNGSMVFPVFDDFDYSDPDDLFDRWYVYPSNDYSVAVRDGYVEIANGSAIVSKKSDLRNGQLVAKAMMVSGEASMFARSQDMNNPYNSSYFFSSGAFPSQPWRNFSVGKDYLLLLGSSNTPMDWNTWYSLNFALINDTFYASRYPYENPEIYEEINVYKNSSYSEGRVGLHTTSSNSLARYDFVFFRNLSSAAVTAMVDAPVSPYYTWSKTNGSLTIPYNLSFYANPSEVIGSDLYCDFVYSNESAYFVASLENGVYSVTLTVGDPVVSIDNMAVYAEGEFIDNITCMPGAFVSKWFDVTVEDGLLELFFEDNGGDTDIWSICSLTVESGVRGIRLGDE